MRAILNTMLIIVSATVFLLGCTGVPEGLAPVTGFDPDRYLGQWFEFARLDHSFERGLTNVSATYTSDADGVLKVINRGFDVKAGEWKQIEGRAKSISDTTVGSLKVSFFGPFYGGYHIIALDKQDYKYAMVSGPSRSYLWILSRQRQLNKDIFERLVSQAGEWGFDISGLIKVKHDAVESN